MNFQNGAHLPSYNGSHCDTNYSFDRTSWKWTIHRCFEQKRNSTQGKFFTNSHRSFHFRHHIHFCLGSNFLHEVSSLGLARVDQQGSGQKVDPKNRPEFVFFSTFFQASVPIDFNHFNKNQIDNSVQ